jgi:tight adherence protein C
MGTLQGTFLAVVFLAASGLTYGLFSLLLRPALPRTQSAADGQSTETQPGGDWLSRIATLSAPVAKLALPKDGWDVSGLRIRFLNAGLRHASWPMLYFSAKALLSLGLPALCMLSLGIGGQFGDSGLFGQLIDQRGSQLILLLLLLLASVGYYLPNLLLHLRIRSHQRELFEAFPDAVDLIIVCIEAGLGLDAAIARTAEELRLRSPALADELHLVGLELRVGASRVKAMRNLALRTGLDEAASLVSMLVQADRFGTSIADSLRVHAESLRNRRRLKAEEAAAKIPLKLLFPLIFCIFPSLILVLVGPAAINIYRVFLKGVVGQ